MHVVYNNALLTATTGGDTTARLRGGTRTSKRTDSDQVSNWDSDRDSDQDSDQVSNQVSNRVGNQVSNRDSYQDISGDKVEIMAMALLPRFSSSGAQGELHEACLILGSSHAQNPQVVY
jgi:hypothetical protein